MHRQIGNYNCAGLGNMALAPKTYLYPCKVLSRVRLSSRGDFPIKSASIIASAGAIPEGVYEAIQY